MKKDKLKVGEKYDQGKPKWALLPYDAIREVVVVFTEGAKKYEERNWEKGLAWSRLFNSAQRHLTDWFQHRETFDPDGTGLRNIAQATWCCLVLTAYELRGMTQFDDRPTIPKRDQEEDDTPAVELISDGAETAIVLDPDSRGSYSVVETRDSDE